MAGHKVKVSVFADTTQFQRAFQGLAKETGLNSLISHGKQAVATFAKVAAAASAAVGAASFKAVQMAGDLEQSTGAIEAVFKGAASQMHQYAKGASLALGISRNQYQELGTLLGAQLKNGGTRMEDLAGKTDSLIKLGADLSAQFGGSTADAVGAISSALKGERDPIEKYGVTLKQAIIDAKAAELGFKKVGNSFSTEAQQAATLALIMEQTADAHGAFARETNTYAHQVQVFKAQFQDLAAAFGTLLLPAATAVARFLNEHLMPALTKVKDWLEAKGIPAFKKFARHLWEEIKPHAQRLQRFFTSHLLPALKGLVAWWNSGGRQVFSGIVKFFRDWGVPILAAIGIYISFYKANNLVMQGILKAKTIIGLAQKAWAAFSTGFAASPIGLVALAIAAVVAGLIALYQHNEKFRNSVNEAWEKIKEKINVVTTWFNDVALPAFQRFQEKASGYWEKTWGFIKTIWEKIGQPILDLIMTYLHAFVDNWDGIWKGMTQTLSGFGEIVGGILTLVLGAIAGILQTWTGILTGDWNMAWEGVKTTYGSVWEGIKGVAHGGAEILKGTLATNLYYIKSIWEGVWDGLKTRFNDVFARLPQAARDNMNGILETIRSIPSAIQGIVSSAGEWLYDAGRNVISGLVRGIRNAIARVRDTLRELTSNIPNWKGPADTDRVLLAPAGRMIITGLVKGLEGEYDQVYNSLNRLTGGIGATRFPTLSTPGAVPVQQSSFHGATINVYALTPTVEVGRAVAEALAQYQRMNGVRA